MEAATVRLFPKTIDQSRNAHRQTYTQRSIRDGVEVIAWLSRSVERVHPPRFVVDGKAGRRTPYTGRTKLDSAVIDTSLASLFASTRDEIKPRANHAIHLSF